MYNKRTKKQCVYSCRSRVTISLKTICYSVTQLPMQVHHQSKEGQE